MIWWQPMQVRSAGIPGSLETATVEWQYMQGIWSCPAWMS
jgi:hypothetical protein